MQELRLSGKRGYLSESGKEEKKTVIDEIEQSGSMDGRAKSTDGCACGNYFTGRL